MNDYSNFTGLTAAQIKRDFFGPMDVVKATEQNCGYLLAPCIDNKKAFMLALAQRESDGGLNNVPRHELAYGPGGSYYQKDDVLKAQNRRYGALAACSWSPWQIMYPVAVELKYAGNPGDLHSPYVAAPYVVEYFNRAFRRGADTLEKLFCSYNHGSFGGRDLANDAYTQACMNFYDGFKKGAIS